MTGICELSSRTTRSNSSFENRVAALAQLLDDLKHDVGGRRGNRHTVEVGCAVNQLLDLRRNPGSKLIDIQIQV